MTVEGRRALATIRRCLEEDRYAVSVHFTERMQQRGLYWPDVEAVIHDPTDVRSQGIDRFHRPKWIIRGETADTGEIEIVCAVEVDDTETEFITLYWED